MVDELNPFVYDDPLPPDALIDRDEETRKLLSLAEGGHNTRLSAPRRYGKTSIILRLLAEADRAGLHTVHVDFYRCVTRGEVARRIEEAYLARLAGPLRRTVSALTRSGRTTVKAQAGGIAVQAEHIRELVRSLGLPTRLSQVGVPESGIPLLVEGAMGDACTLVNPRAPSAEELAELYRRAL